MPPQAYFVERIGGGRVSVQVLVPPASAPESYEPSPRQMLALGRARLYVAVGHPAFTLERRQLAAILERNPDLVLTSAAEGVALAPGGDPHLWLSPPLVEIAAGNIADALERLDPDGAAAYRSNLEAFREEVRALDRRIAARLAGFEGREFFVYHPAWSHFAERYGLVEVPIERGGKEPSPVLLLEQIARARRAGARVIFVQRGFSDRSARVIAAQLGAAIEPLDPLARDWPTNLELVASKLREALSRD